MIAATVHWLAVDQALDKVPPSLQRRAPFIEILEPIVDGGHPADRPSRVIENMSAYAQIGPFGFRVGGMQEPGIVAGVAGYNTAAHR